MGQAALQEWFINCWQANFRHLFSRRQGRPQQAALMAKPDENNVPPPEFKFTPLNWLAQQPPETAIVVFIGKPSLKIMEVVSMPRENLIGFLRYRMHRDPEAKWEQDTSDSLRHMDFDPATELAAHAAATEELEFLLTARRCLSDEMLTLDLLISTVFAEVCPDLADAAHTENTSDTNNTNTTETYNEQEAAKQLAKTAAQNEPKVADKALFTARLMLTSRHARSKITPTNKRELLAVLLYERKLATEEMAQMDVTLLPAMRKLGLNHDDD
jgi:hypothetical protein